MSSEKFLVTIDNLTFCPDLSAIREFGVMLKQKLDSDPAFKQKFEDDPRAFLNNAGVAVDLQREILVGAGMGGIKVEEADCTVTCLITECRLGTLL